MRHVTEWSGRDRNGKGWRPNATKTVRGQNFNYSTPDREVDLVYHVYSRIQGQYVKQAGQWC